MVLSVYICDKQTNYNMRIFLMITILLSASYNTFGQRDFSDDYFIYDNKGKLQQTIRYDLVKPGNDDLIIIAKNGKYGVYNYKTNTIVTDLIYRDIISVFPNHLALAKNKSDKWGLINIKNNNEVVLPFEYYNITELNDRYYSVTQFDRKTGVYDVVEKRFVIPCQFDTRIILKDDVFVIRHQNQYALYGKKGEIVMPFQKQKFYLSYIYPIININRNNKTLLFNSRTLNYQTELEFDEFPIVFGPGYATVTIKNKQYFLHHSGRLLNQDGFEEVDFMNDYGYARVKKDGFWGVIDTLGKTMLPFKYETKNSCPELYHNGIYQERFNKDFQGIKKLDGSWLIPPKYYYFVIKKNCIMGFHKNQAFSLFDTNGKLLKSMPPNEIIEPFGNLYNYTNEEGKTGWMNQKFKIKGQPNNAFLDNFPHPKFAIIASQQNGWKYGAVNHKGKVIIPLENEIIQTYYAPHNIIFVKNINEKWRVHNLKGKQIIDGEFSKKMNLKNGWVVLAK